MMILLILLTSLILLFWGIKKYTISAIEFCWKKDEFYRDVLYLIHKEKIPIMETIVAHGMLPTEFRNRVMSKENQKIYIDIYNRYKLHYVSIKTLTPEMFYNIFKKELCGNLSERLNQALKEAKTLRLENKSK